MSTKRPSRRETIYEETTNTIITHLEGNLEGWRRPWFNIEADDGLARNPSRQDTPYKGVNQLILSMTMMSPNNDFLRNQWLTYKQSGQLGGQVRKGSKSIPVTWYSTKYLTKDGKYVGKDRAKAMSREEKAAIGLQTVPMLKVYNVFNVAQVEGLDPSFYEPPKEVKHLTEWEKDDRAEALIKATGAKVVEMAGNKAFYRPSSDTIHMPLRGQFNGAAEWYGTTLHELGHWTGAETRLNRDMGKPFGSNEYAREELTAELTSAFVCAHLGYSKLTTNNANYLKSWLGALKEDNKAIFKAAAAAQRASDFILDAAGYTADALGPDRGLSF